MWRAKLVTFCDHILLQERRTALISASVTGKIEVRPWQPVVGSKLGKTTAVTG
jgi:hypothetical protein